MSAETDRLIVRISQLWKVRNENLLECFMEKYNLQSLSKATEEQLQEFLDYCTKP